MLGLENAKHQIAKFETLTVKRSGHRHGSRVDKKPEIEHDMGNEGIPFLSAKTTLSKIFGRKTEE
jgi:hypothetical protein